MADLRVRVKDPGATLDHEFTWSSFLGADAISDSTWTAPEGLTVDDNLSTFTATTTSVWLTGGTAGEWYPVVNHIVTAGAREDERTLWILCANR